MTYTVAMKIIENLGDGAGQHAEVVVDRLPTVDVAAATRRVAENALAALDLDKLATAPEAEVYQDVVQQLELGARGNSTELVATLHFPELPAVREFTAGSFFDSVRVRNGGNRPGGWLVVNLPEAIAADPGDTVRVVVSPDGRTAVVQHNTEGAAHRLLATSLHLPPHTPMAELVDRVVAGDLVLTEVTAFADQHGYPLREGKIRDDAAAMLWDVHHRVRAFASVVAFADREGLAIKPDSLAFDTEKMLAAMDRRVALADVAKFAGLPSDVGRPALGTWVSDARTLIERVDEMLDVCQAFPATIERTMANRIGYLERLIERVPLAGEDSPEGETWHDASGSDHHLVFDSSEVGDSTAVVSVYEKDDGPGVALDADQLREVAARFLARAETLDQSAPWSDPHDEVKGTVSWPTTYDPECSNASTTCCGRIECIDGAADWVKKLTGHLGVWTVHAKSPSEDR